MKASVWFAFAMALSTMIAACETPADSTKGADAAASAKVPPADAAVASDPPKVAPTASAVASTTPTVSASAAVPSDAGAPDAAAKNKTVPKK